MPRRSFKNYESDMDAVLEILNEDFKTFLETPQYEDMVVDKGAYHVRGHWFDPKWDMSHPDPRHRPLLEIRVDMYNELLPRATPRSKIRADPRRACFFLYKGGASYREYKGWRVQGPI
jgi:hypothetical protein